MLGTSSVKVLKLYQSNVKSVEAGYTQGFLDTAVLVIHFGIAVPVMCKLAGSRVVRHGSEVLHDAGALACGWVPDLQAFATGDVELAVVGPHGPGRSGECVDHLPRVDVEDLDAVEHRLVVVADPLDRDMVLVDPRCGLVPGVVAVGEC
jgi:hypothetical protein